MIQTPIFIARQIFRHRSFSYNEESKRYTNGEVEFWHPSEWRKQSTVNKQGSFASVVDQLYYLNILERVYREALEAYEHLIEHGIANEQARAVLPQGMMTSFWMTGNLRNWAHFLELRLDEHAQAEVQEVAIAIYDHLLTLFPVALKALGILPKKEDEVV